MSWSHSDAQSHFYVAQTHYDFCEFLDSVYMPDEFKDCIYKFDRWQSLSSPPMHKLLLKSRAIAKGFYKETPPCYLIDFSVNTKPKNFFK